MPNWRDDTSPGCCRIIEDLERFATREANVERMKADLTNAEAEHRCIDELTAGSYFGDAMV